MSTIQYLFRFTMYLMVIVILGILIGDLGSRRNEEAIESPVAPLEPKPVAILQAIPSKPELLSKEPANVQKEKPSTYRDRMERFSAFQSKVLLRNQETMEKQRLLAHLKTIHWIEAQLSTIPADGKETLRDRLTMIDFFEEALAWQENPIRSEVIDSMERTLKVRNLGGDSKEKRRMLAGDKIELFAILAQESPERARELLEHTEDKQLQNIFQYAVKRLALKKLGESR